MKRLSVLFTFIISVLLLKAQTGYSAPQSIYTVDRSDDTSGLACTSAAADCTLRSAIEQANASPANDSILFDQGRTINLSSQLPTITGNNVAIAAWPSQDVNINANGANHIFVISGDNIFIAGLDLYGGNTGVGDLVMIQGTAENIKIYDNLIGDSIDTPTACGTYEGGFVGINLVADGAGLSGGTRLYAYGNTFHCLGGDGMVLAGSNAVVGEDSSGAAGGDQQNIFDENRSGILVAGSSGHRIRNNVIGPSTNYGIAIDYGTAVQIYGNTIAYNGTDGIYLVNGAQTTTIGCTTTGSFDATRRNYIYRNETGIHISGQLTSATRSTGFNYAACNYIGLASDGSASDNTEYGVWLSEGAYSNYIGSTLDKANVIGSNVLHGVYIQDSKNNLIQGNYIGTLENDTLADKGNHGSGIAIEGGASQSNTIGGSAGNNRNVIVFNDGDGVYLNNAGAQNKIQNSYIGDSNRANTRAGIGVFNTNGTLIGTNTSCALASSDCLLSYTNGQEGILLDHADNTLISSGTYVYGNGADGVKINNGDSNTIYPHLVGGNGGAAVVVTDISARNPIQIGTAYSNTGLPIDLNGDGFTANDAGDGDSGPNDLLNFPVTDSPAGSVNVSGTACTGCVVNVYQYSPADDRYTFLNGTVADNITGDWSFDLASYSLTQDEVAFTATDVSFNTSEMSPLGGVVSYSLFLPLISK